MTCPDCEKFQIRIKTLEEQLKERERSIAELKRRLALYENPNTPPSLSRYPRRSRKQKGGKRFPGRPKGHPGSARRKPKPDVVKAPERKERCDRCGKPLGEPSYVNHRIVEEISNLQPRQVIDFLEFEWKCKACKAYTVSRHPDCPPDGWFGKNVLVQTTLMKFEDRLPYKKVCGTLERTYRLRVTPATAFDITRRVSEWLRPEYEAVKERVRKSKVVYADETGEKVDGGKHWLWCFTTDTETLYVIRKSRGKNVLEETLGKDFKGFLVCDGWKSYPSFTRRIQRDWAHMLREAECLAQDVKEAEPLNLALHKLFEDITVPLMDKPPPKERRRLKQKAKRRLRYWINRKYNSAETVRFIQKLSNGFEYWFTFITVPGVEPTSNRAERALKEPVVQRKIIGTFRNRKGTRIYETLLTLLTTWKQRGLNPSTALADALTTTWAKS